MENKLNQNDLEHLLDLIQRGEITAEQANVEKVRMARFQVVTSSIPAQVRKALNSAVKVGVLAHKKKDGHKPEVYYHPDFEHLANEARNMHEFKILKSLVGVLSKAELI